MPINSLAVDESSVRDRTYMLDVSRRKPVTYSNKDIILLVVEGGQSLVDFVENCSASLAN